MSAVSGSSAGIFGQRLEQHLARAGLVHLRQGGEGFVTELRREVLARQQREVHGPIPDVGVLALDEGELFVGQAAELVIDRARRLIEQDARRLIGVRGMGRQEHRPEKRAAEDGG